MLLFDEPGPQMSTEEYRLLGELVSQYCGIVLRPESRAHVARRLGPRLKAVGAADFTAYYRHLRFEPEGGAELEAAAESLTTHETYFFREPLQLRAFCEELLPMLERAKARSRRLRIWSAGCSTGEEAYTLAMLLLDSGRFGGWELEVVGTDLSRRALAAARRASYAPSALREAPAPMVARYFREEGDRLAVRDEVRELVTFGQLNLLDESGRGNRGRVVDVAFCRNVMIYFDSPARRRALRALWDRLGEGGYLLLGHAESLIHLTADFELVHLKHDLVYRKPRAAEGPR
jgi:chemotaxis protein methyltransferase CheR